MRLVALSVLVALVGVTAGACGDSADTPPAPAAPPATPAPQEGSAGDSPDEAPWIDFQGTTTLGFGILRLVPPPGGSATFEIRYRDTPDGYAMSDNAQLLVLPGDAFAATEMAYADDFLAFTRTPPPVKGAGYASELKLDVSVTVTAETTVIVGYGPWTGADVGRPSGDDHTFDLHVVGDEPLAEHEWVESEAGELITMNWTQRPGLARGGSIEDPITTRPVWLEVRPLILYDARLARSSDEPAATLPGSGPSPAALDQEAELHVAAGRDDRARDAQERAADLRAELERRDRRIVLTPGLTERFRRVPIRWR